MLLWFGGGKDILLEMLPLDLIILDLMFPGGKSGFDIFQEIRSWSQVDAVPIIAVSAMDTSVAMPKVRDLGFAGFISKPVNMDLFPRQIRPVIDGEPVWNTAPSSKK